jgi:hypothetical protein
LVVLCVQRLRKEQDAVIKKINKIHSKLSDSIETGARKPRAERFSLLATSKRPCLCGICWWAYEIKHGCLIYSSLECNAVLTHSRKRFGVWGCERETSTPSTVR